MREQLPIVAIKLRNPERLRRPAQSVGGETACSDQFSPRDALRQVLRMTASETTKAGDSDTQARCSGQEFSFKPLVRTRSLTLGTAGQQITVVPGDPATSVKDTGFPSPTKAFGDRPFAGMTVK